MCFPAHRLHTQLAPRPQPRFRRPACPPNALPRGLLPTRQPRELVRGPVVGTGESAVAGGIHSGPESRCGRGGGWFLAVPRGPHPTRPAPRPVRLRSGVCCVTDGEGGGKGKSRAGSDLGVTVCVAHAFFRTPFPGSESLQPRVGVGGQIPSGRSPPSGGGEAAGTVPSPPAVAAAPARRKPPEGGQSRAPGSLPPRTRPRVQGPDSVLSAPGSCPILPSPQFPSAHTQLGVARPTDLSPAEWPWSRGAPDRARFCVGGLAWEGWGLTWPVGAPSHPLPPCPGTCGLGAWPLPGSFPFTCGQQRGADTGSWQRLSYRRLLPAGGLGLGRPPRTRS